MTKKTPVTRKKLDLDRVLVGVLKLLLENSADEITFAKVSRECNIPRPTLYYYFGKSMPKLIDDAIRFGMQHFVQLEEFTKLDEFKTWKEFERYRMSKSLRRAPKLPWMVALYFRFRNESSEIGKAIRSSEEVYFQHMMRAWKYYHPGAPSLHGIRFMGYLKLGLFFGFAHDHAWWNSKTHRGQRDYFLERFLDFSQECSQTRKA